MALDQTQLDIAVTNAQCCAVDLALEVIALRKMGDFSWEKKNTQFQYLVTAIQSLQNLDVDDLDCMDDATICEYLGSIRSLCSDCC